MNTQTFTVSINRTDVLNEIYASSAWHAIAHPSTKRLSPDWQRLILKKMEAGYHDFHSHFMGYIHRASFNPKIDEGFTQVEFQFLHNATDVLKNEVSQALAHLLAQYTLNEFYAADSDLYATAWRKFRMQLSLIFSRDANGLT